MCLKLREKVAAAQQELQRRQEELRRLRDESPELVKEKVLGDMQRRLERLRNR
jgi:hypothetical protein